jgi:D-amino peptidase
VNIFIHAELAGSAGVYTWEQITPGTARHAQACVWATREVSAAAAGAFDAGASRVVVADRHWQCSNLAVDELDERVELIQQAGRPWHRGLDDSFEALLILGAHAKAGAQGAMLHHTFDPKSWLELQVNGRSMGELGLAASMAGELGVRCVLVSGDESACNELRDLLPAVETAVVKWGYHAVGGRSLTPKAACKLIRERAAAALSRRSEIEPLRIAPPVRIELKRLAVPADRRLVKPDQLAALQTKMTAAEADTVAEAFDRLLQMG